MPLIEIDFEVFKALTARRESEDMSYNDVIRALIELPPKNNPQSSPQQTAAAKAWVCKGVVFPEGTEFRAFYKGIEHRGLVRDGALLVNGASHNNPSNPAMMITGTTVNGWRFWQCRLPGENAWRPMSSLR